MFTTVHSGVASVRYPPRAAKQGDRHAQARAQLIGLLARRLVQEAMAEQQQAERFEVDRLARDDVAPFASETSAAHSGSLAGGMLDARRRCGP